MISNHKVNNVNFSANFVREVTILKRDAAGLYQTYGAKLIEFDIGQEKNKIREICYSKDFLTFGDRLYKDLKADTYCGSIVQKRCYALVTEEENNLDNINPSNVLGLFSLHEDKTAQKSHTIPFFMTNRKYRSDGGAGHNLFTGIGKGMINALKELFPTGSLEGNSSVYSIEFWKKNGFKPISDRHLIYKGQ